MENPLRYSTRSSLLPPLMSKRQYASPECAPDTFIVMTWQKGFYTSPTSSNSTGLKHPETRPNRTDSDSQWQKYSQLFIIIIIIMSSLEYIEMYIYIHTHPPMVQPQSKANKHNTMHLSHLAPILILNLAAGISLSAYTYLSTQLTQLIMK